MRLTGVYLKTILCPLVVKLAGLYHFAVSFSDGFVGEFLGLHRQMIMCLMTVTPNGLKEDRMEVICKKIELKRREGKLKKRD